MVMTAQALELARALLQGEDDVETAYLFGSAAGGDAVEPRDVDIAVCLSPDVSDPFRRALTLQAKLEAAVDVPIDLHELDRLPLDMQFSIIRRPLLLVDRQPLRRQRREARIMVMYYDFAPTLDFIRESKLRRIRAEGGDGG